MEPNTYLLIGVAVLSMFFGYFFGLFEGRGQGYKKRSQEEQAGQQVEGDQEEDPDLLSDAGLPAPKEAAVIPSLLRLSRDLDGRLVLDLDDERVEATGLDSDRRRRLIVLLTAMRPWLGLEGEEGAPADPGPKPPPPQAETAAPGPAPAPTPPAAARPAPAPAEPPVSEEPSKSPQSIVAQIDSILQMRLAGTVLHDRGIKLQESPEGGVLVWVGLQKYQSVDEVPDEPIKTAIRAAIIEWENRFTPSA